MKLCVFQGTFNPIHNVHLAMANFVKNTYDFESILFIPAYKPPHKEFDEDMSNHRFKMVKYAISGDNFFNISNIEFQNERFSYTTLTIEELYKRYKIDGKIGFIIGMDAFREIDTWYETDRLKNLVNFIVFQRGAITEADIVRDRERLSLLHYKGYKFTIAKMEPINVSSSMIREKIAEGKSIASFVPIRAQEYIRENGLYREKEE